MVERLKIAVAKARAARERTLAGLDPVAAAEAGSPVSREEREALALGSVPSWNGIEPLELTQRDLERHRIVTQDRTDRAHVAFDVLRTRLMRAFQKHGWSRLGITSPNPRCGKTFVATNLALSLSRQSDLRVVLMDLDLRKPRIAETLGIRHPEPAKWFLSGDVPAEDYLRRVGHNLAVGLNGERVRDAAELLLAPRTASALETMLATLAPDVVIYDLPPLLTSDDVLGFLPQLDCVLLVVGGGRTRPEQVSECERLLADQTHLLGVLLNQAEGADPSRYGYE